MRFGTPLAVLAAGLLAGGCGGPQRASEPPISPIELGAPRCHDGDPTVQIVRAQQARCGKGDECTILDLAIRNPEQRALWLLDDARIEFSGYLESINILHERFVSSVPVWEFSGQNYHRALRLAPGTDIIVRNLEYRGRLQEFHAVFFDRIVLNYDRQVDGQTPGGLLPEQGDFDLQWLSRSDYDSKRLYPLEGKERVSLGKWCAQTVPVPR